MHFIGTHGYFAGTQQIAHDRGVPTVVSSIWYRPKPPWRVAIDATLKKATRTYPYETAKLLDQANLVFVPTMEVASRLRAFFGVNNKRLFRIPNCGVDSVFASADPSLFRKYCGIDEDFVLHVGMLTPRKNQLGLIRALASANKRVVFLGRVMHRAYAEACFREAGPNSVFLDPLPPGSPLIASAYAAARVVCIPSFLEDFLIAGMEAGVAGARLVLSKNWNPQELYEDFALYPDARSPGSIREAVEAAWLMPKPTDVQREWFLKRYSWEVVARKLIQGYDMALSTFKKSM